MSACDGGEDAQTVVVVALPFFFLAIRKETNRVRRDIVYAHDKSAHLDKFEEKKLLNKNVVFYTFFHFLKKCN